MRCVVRFVVLLAGLFALAAPSLAAAAASVWPPAAAALGLRSSHVLVVDATTGKPLLAKDAETPAPMASLTKLLTAMVVLDAGQDLHETLVITEEDLDRIKHTRRGLAVGTPMQREQMLEIALQASDNRAASALARHYPGGLDAFVAAAARKVHALGLRQTVLVEPTGLSPHNRSSAADMAIVLRAAAAYPLIESATRAAKREMLLGDRMQTVHNTNALVGREGWDVQLSKTGYTREAGRCLVMRIQEAGHPVHVVLMGGFEPDARQRDTLNIRRWLRGEAPLKVRPPRPAPQKKLAQAPRAKPVKASQQPGPRPAGRIARVDEAAAPL